MTPPEHYSANLSMLFTELPLLRRPAAAAAAGFAVVEAWWPFAVAEPPAVELDAFARSVEDAGVRLVGLNFFAGDMPSGERGVVSDPSRTGEFRANIPVAVDLGARLGCRAFNALYGNRLEGSSPDEQDAVATENLALAARATAEVDGVVLVEPLSGAARYPLRTAAEAVAVVDRVQRHGEVDNVRLLLDLYHLAANDDDVEAAIDAYADRVGHVQIADHPGRHEPGTGTLAVNDLLARLTAAGYDGFVGLEYAPAGDTLAGLRWLGDRSSSATALANQEPTT